MSKSDIDLWMELEDARTQGLIKRLEEVSAPLQNQSHMRLYGTRVWFRPGVTSHQVTKVREYIREEYNLEVSNETPISLIIWDQNII